MAGRSTVSRGGFGGRSNVGFFQRLRSGLLLTKDSIAVLRDHPSLMAFPALAALSSVAFWVVFLVPLLVADLIGTGAELIVLFIVYLGTTFLATFFTASLVFAVNQAFHGEDPDLRESMRAAWRRKGAIFVWAVVAATVSLILKRIQESDSSLSRIAASIFAVGWTVATFFVVPVIVFEEVTVRSMFTRSADTFRGTWGESIGVGLGISLLEFVGATVGIVTALVVAGLIWLVAPLAGVGIGIVLVVGVLVGTHLVGQTIWGITKTALYVYAAEDRIPPQFDDFDFETLGGRTERRATPGTVTAPRRHLDR